MPEAELKPIVPRDLPIFEGFFTGEKSHTRWAPTIAISRVIDPFIGVITPVTHSQGNPFVTSRGPPCTAHATGIFTYMNG